MFNSKLSQLFFFIFILRNLLFAEDVKICLTMIVKNESQIIERCLESVKDIVDCISICDTGSSDETVEIIESFLKRNQMPGKVYRHEWKNFGYNRTLSYLEAKNTLEEFGLDVSKTYLLLLDADMMLEWSPEFNKNQLHNAGYRIIQRGGDLAYYNVRLIRPDLDWECKGATHEVWCLKSGHLIPNLDSLAILDIGDGGSKADKFERDKRLLTEALKEEPNNPRYMFYLAQTYLSLGEYENAITWYQNRINQRGWDEEVWYAKFMIGVCNEKLGDWNLAFDNYLEAYQFRPSRAEPLYSIANYFKLHNKHILAFYFASEAQKIKYPQNDSLFVNHQIYNSLIDEVLSISSYYCNFKDKGFSSNEKLIFNKNASKAVKYQALVNAQYYAQPIKNLKLLKIPIEAPRIRENSSFFYNPMNPSIYREEDGYAVVVRCVNYLQNHGSLQRSIDPEVDNGSWDIKTRNFFLKFDNDFHLITQHELVDEISFAFNHLPLSRIVGNEDVRLFKYGNAFWFTATKSDLNKYHVPQMGLFRLSNCLFDDAVTVDYFVPLKGPIPERCEKNWMPFIRENDLYVIYSYDPYVIYKVDSRTGNLILERSQNQKHDFSHLRGSAPPIPFADGYLMLVHEVSFDGKKRVYLHRFLALDKDYNMASLSRPFFYDHIGVEYCCGMTLDHVEENLIMTIGIEDREAFFAIADVNTVKEMLKPLH
jgi:glycosyltransferase involved in cell wall biosynthesis